MGEWDVRGEKVGDGMNGVVEGGEKEGVKLGVWIEGEMVNGKSELFEKDGEWGMD